MGGYAANTTVPADRSEAEIKRTLQRYGADEIISGTWVAKSQAFVQFVYEKIPIRLTITLPNKNDDEFTMTPRSGQRRSDDQILKGWEKACRQKWRVLLLLIKAQLEAIDNEIMKPHEAFLPWVMLPEGGVVADRMLPIINKIATEGISPKLLGFNKTE